MAIQSKNNLKILVTGSSGFLGKALVLLLKRLNYFVIGIDKVSNILSFNTGCDEFYQIDLREHKNLPKIKFDLCIHLASEVGGFLFNAENDFIIQNEREILQGVIKLCEYSLCKRIIYTSSINVFEAQEECINDRISVLNQYTPYAKAKALAEEVIERNFKSFTIIRPTNLFGADQERRQAEIGQSHVIPDLLHKIRNSQNNILEVLGTGLQLRNFLHVSDAARFIITKLNFSTSSWVNLRSEISITIGQLAKELLQYSGKKLTIIFKPEYTAFEPRMKLQRFSLSKEVSSSWIPLINSIEQGLNEKGYFSEEYYSQTPPNPV